MVEKLEYFVLYVKFNAHDALTLCVFQLLSEFRIRPSMIFTKRGWFSFVFCKDFHWQSGVSLCQILNYNRRSYDN